MKNSNDEIDLFAESETVQWERVLLRLLASPRPRREAERRLREKNCPEETAQELLDRYEEVGLIDDRAYAVLFAEGKKNWGARRIRDELRFRGVSRDDIDAALEECCDDEEERAYRLLRQWERIPGMTEQKLDGRLRRRGFSSSSVRRAFERLSEEIEEETQD
ncbi:MAG: regulatory protein RecX [Pyramidobacter sp.]|nr:regulatory protein RecX [Pyramidobacter sp.]